MTTGVLVMSYGTPTTPADVEAYYTRIRHGRPPTPEQLADLVRRYEAIGGNSPLAARTRAQVLGIRRALAQQTVAAYDVRDGAKYEPPLIEEVALELRNANVDAVVGLVMAPHTSSLSTAQYHERAAAVLQPTIPYRAVRGWWGEKEFVRLMARRVTRSLASLAPEDRADCVVLFTAHSLPVAVLNDGDSYVEQLRDSAHLVATEADLPRWDVAWQSAGRTSDEWLGPDLLSALRALREEGRRAVVVCPIGFVADHLEVLYDVDIEAAAFAADIGLMLVRTASLNDDADFVKFLASLIVNAP